ncbi:hypothetical protein RCH20_000828 [Psychrobacter sp. PL15]|uniref:tetratricopeptide repeat protein n=1 Tax=Psychrobacter sp. PL15 TaxID=3071719 RepID=UPI002DFD9ACA|nr:hypothetical protein [Psychrobacter sp. PL15]
MKLIHVGQDEWMFEDSVIDFPNKKSASNKSGADSAGSALNIRVKAFVETEVKKGRDINDIMNEVMTKFQNEIMQEVGEQPPTSFQVIRMTLEKNGYEAARDVAEFLVLENIDDPDAYFNLAFLCEEHGDSFLALLSSRECMRLYLRYFPQKFNWQQSKLPWGIMENRAFLRALFQLTNVYADNGNFELACTEGEKLLQVCPNDNLGIRERLVELYMLTEQYQKIIQLCDSYPEDMLANIAFGKVLAYCYQDKLDKAEKAWDIAQKNLPNIAHEILKKRHTRPRGLHSSNQGIEIGGKEQAYLYWEDMGEWWEDNATAQALIEKKRAEKKKKK